jgi:hypothetical protein
MRRNLTPAKAGAYPIGYPDGKAVIIYLPSPAKMLAGRNAVLTAYRGHLNLLCKAFDYRNVGTGRWGADSMSDNPPGWK